MLAAIALVFARHGHDLAVVLDVAARRRLVPRLRTRAPGREPRASRGDVGLGSRAERVVVITCGLVLAPWGGLPWAIVLTGLTWLTVVQRVWHVRARRCCTAVDSTRRAISSFPTDSKFCDYHFPWMARERRSVLVRMPAALKQRLAEEVAVRGASLNDVAVGLLASRFAVPYAPTGRRGIGPRARGDVLLRMPPELKEKLARRASERRRNTNDLIVETLSEGLGLKGEGSMASTNGKPRPDEKVRVAIIGVGNCANSLLQGVEYYKDAPDDQFVPGLMHVNLGGYHIRDIEFTAAFDVVKGKVGEDLADAMWAHPNDTIKFADVPKTGVKVSRGMTHDGIGKYLSEVVEKAPGKTDDIVGILKETKTDVVVNYLPVGSEMATKWYAEQILEAGCAMVNCMPVFIAREDVLAEAVRGRRRADHRRRHQVAGRRHDHAPRAHLALPRARHPPRQDDAAERRRQLGLPQHARARAPRVEEDLEDERRHVDARLRPRRRATSTSARPTTCRG